MSSSSAIEKACADATAVKQHHGGATPTAHKDFVVDQIYDCNYDLHYDSKTSFTDFLTAVKEGNKEMFRIAASFLYVRIGLVLDPTGKKTNLLPNVTLYPPPAVSASQEVINWETACGDSITESFQLSLAAFVVGWQFRGPTGRAIQMGKLGTNLEGILSRSLPTIPDWFFNGLKSTGDRAPTVTNCAKGVLAATVRHLEQEPNVVFDSLFFYTLYRPICAPATVLSRRFAEFEKRFPKQIIEKPARLTNPDFLDGVVALTAYWSALGALSSAKKSPYQAMISRVITPGYFSAFSDPGAKRMAGALLFCLCIASGKMEDWESFKAAKYTYTVFESADEPKLRLWITNLMKSRADSKFAGFDFGGPSKTKKASNFSKEEEEDVYDV